MAGCRVSYEMNWTENNSKETIFLIATLNLKMSYLRLWLGATSIPISNIRLSIVNTLYLERENIKYISARWNKENYRV